ncbi:MAG: response regulator [Candidatus Omnitrophota bacterium]
MNDIDNKQKGKGNILIVEDSLTQAEQIEHILEEHGFNVRVTFNGQEALDYLGRYVPDIIISDVIMPGMDGYELCTKIKKNKTLSHIPVVLLTALSEPLDIVRGLESGANNFMVKPYQKEYLLSQIDYMISNSRLRSLYVQGAEIPEMTLKIYFGGKQHSISSGQLQILDILLSTFEAFVQKNAELEKMNRELAEKNDRIKALQGLIPICANCKKIRDDAGYWNDVDAYLRDHSEADINLSLCPDCTKKRKLKE